MVQGWSVRPAAIAGVRSRHFGPDASLRRRRRSWHHTKLEAVPTRNMPAVRRTSRWASARVRRASGARQARKVACTRALEAVVICWLPPLAVVNTCATASVPPRTTRLGAAHHAPLGGGLHHRREQQPGGTDVRRPTTLAGQHPLPAGVRAGPDRAAQAVHTDQHGRGAGARPDRRGQRADPLLVAAHPEHAA
jgi:hypothetical protein